MYVSLNVFRFMLVCVCVCVCVCARADSWLKETVLLCFRVGGEGSVCQDHPWVKSTLTPFCVCVGGVCMCVCVCERESP